jgi:hypothetical protein
MLASDVAVLALAGDVAVPAVVEGVAGAAAAGAATLKMATASRLASVASLTLT